MSCIAQIFQNWGAMIQTTALVATLIVIIIYTCETRKLREVTVKQTELSLRPFIIIDSFSTPQSLVYKNIGHSHALDVKTEPFDAEAFILNFEKWGLIEIDEKRDLNIKGEGKNPIADGLIQAVPVPSFTPQALNERDSNLELILNIHYKNMEKVPYQTQVKISRKGIEILDTGKLFL